MGKITYAILQKKFKKLGLSLKNIGNEYLKEKHKMENPTNPPIQRIQRIQRKKQLDKVVSIKKPQKKFVSNVYRRSNKKVSGNEASIKQTHQKLATSPRPLDKKVVASPRIQEVVASPTKKRKIAQKKSRSTNNVVSKKQPHTTKKRVSKVSHSSIQPHTTKKPLSVGSLGKARSRVESKPVKNLLTKNYQKNYQKNATNPNISKKKEK